MQSVSDSLLYLLLWILPESWAAHCMKPSNNTNFLLKGPGEDDNLLLCGTDSKPWNMHKLDEKS